MGPSSPGLCLMLSLEPHFDVTLLRSTFLLSICTCWMSHRAFNQECSKHCTGIWISRYFHFYKGLFFFICAKRPIYTWNYHHQDKLCSFQKNRSQIVLHIVAVMQQQKTARIQPATWSQCASMTVWDMVESSLSFLKLKLIKKPQYLK